MNPELTRRQLDAGGWILPDSECDLSATESIVARSYCSPVLGERVVVKLSSDRLLPAEDLAMEYLGLQPKSASKPLARQYRTALDFAHWALIHQPKDARYALDLVKRMKGAERKASSKPGHAWDLYAEMAGELNTSARNFLPSFWEQVARSFKEIGNTTYSGRALNKALEAERVHAVKIDREHRRDTVLEFSLSGCLSGKALSDYSRDLSNQFSASEAYDTYRDLLIRRTLGGMPPTATAGTDLIRLAKAANLDVNTEVESFLEKIISAPAMVRAPLQFWKSVQKQVGRIVKRSDAFAMWLLVHTDPKASYNSDSPVWNWLDLLDEWKALQLLWRPTSQLPQGVEIPGGRVGFITRLVRVELPPHKRVFELLENMAVVLRDDNIPLEIRRHSARRWEVDADILDLCLDLKIPLVDETEIAALEFSGWLREAIDHPRRNSQLANVAGDTRFQNHLLLEMPNLVKFKGDAPESRPSYQRQLPRRRAFELAAANHPHVIKAWSEHIQNELKELETGGLIQLERTLSRLREATSPITIAHFPFFVERLESIEIANNLHRTFVAGVFDEYGWEALDRHIDPYPLPTAVLYSDNHVFYAFPCLTYLSQGMVHTLRGDSVSEPVALIMKSSEKLDKLIAFGNDVLVTFRRENYDRCWRWLSENHEANKKMDSYIPGYAWPLVATSDSGWFTGTRTFHAGDPSCPTFDSDWLSDGTRFWKLTDVRRWQFYGVYKGPPTRCWEVDPLSGKSLRESVPPFFETELPSGSEVLWANSYLLPCPEMHGKSPLGSRDGLIGWRIVRRRDGTYEGLGIDGRKVTLPDYDPDPMNPKVPVSLIDKPSSQEYWLVTSAGDVIDQSTGIVVCEFNSNSSKYHAGQPTVLPTLFRHYLRLRHEPSSLKLRQTDIAKARELIRLAEIEFEARRVDENPDKPDLNRSIARNAVSEWLVDAPQRLQTGVNKLLEVAVGEQFSLRKLVAKCLEWSKLEVEGSTKTSDSKELQIRKADAGLEQLQLESLAIRMGGTQIPAGCFQHILAVSEFLTGADITVLPKTNYFWLELLRDPVAISHRSFWRTATNVNLGEKVSQRIRSPWLDALKLFATSGLLELSKSGQLRLYRRKVRRKDDGSAPEDFDSRVGLDKPICFEEAGSRYIAYRFWGVGYSENYIYVLENALNGVPKPPNGFFVDETYSIRSDWDREQMVGFIEMVEKIESLPLPESAELEKASAELDLPLSAVALTYWGDLRTIMYGQEKLTPELRDFYGLKVKEIQSAIAQLEAEPPPESIGCEYLRHHPIDGLVENRNQALALMTEKWKQKRDSMISLPPELVAVLDKVSHRYSKWTSKFSQLISAPGNSNFFVPSKISLRIQTDSYKNTVLEVVETPPTSFDSRSLFFDLVRSIAIANYYLPAKHSVRKQIGKLIASMHSFIDHPDPLFSFGGEYTKSSDKPEESLEQTLNRYSTLVGPLTKSADGVYLAENDLVFVGVSPPYIRCFFRSAKLKSEADLNRVVAVARETYYHYGDASLWIDAARGVLSVRDSVFISLSEWNENSPVPEGKWDQNPSLSVPHIVDSVAGKLEIGLAAATLYLQVLSLPDPTSKNLLEWNEWTAKQLKSALTELYSKDLLVEAKRSRAGRDFFLPGGWEDLKSPNLPIETWKLSLFGYQSTDRFRGYSPDFIVFKGPLPKLFQSAWEKFENGGRPSYVEAVIKKGRGK